MTSAVFVDLHRRFDGWAYTKKQELEGRMQLKRIADSYPIPKKITGIKKGIQYTVDKNSTVTQLHEKLSLFLSHVKKQKKYSISQDEITSIGDIPLKKINDPILSRNVDQIWTLDVSYNPALSIKDIMAKQMIEDAIKAKKIIAGKTIIVEATSGNTGAGLALIGAAHGLKIVLVVPSKVSVEKIYRLRKLGAHIVVAPTHVAPNDFKSYYSIRDYLGKNSNTWVPQQYDNLSNTKAHQEVTGPHIWNITKGRITAVIAPTGTGGTISGIGRYLKKKNKKIKIIGVDTVGSILYLLKKGYTLSDVQKYAHSYDIQGFGEDIFPKNLDLPVIDEYIRVSDMSGLQMTRLLPALGFFQGQSSGASYAALIDAIAKNIITKKDNVLVIFPDVGLPYRHDVFNDKWMSKKKFLINY